MKTLYVVSLILGSALALGMTSGCQSTVGGQTLPSPYYLEDDVQYFPAGPEDALYRERAALQQASEEEAVKRQ